MKKRRWVLALFISIFLRNRSLSDARWFYGKKRKFGKGNLYLTENRLSWNEMCCALDNHKICVTHVQKGKSILQVPDTGTRVLDNTIPFLCSSIVSFWITLACSKERKYHIFGQYWYTKNVPVLTNTGTFQYLGPEVYFFLQKNFLNSTFN